MKERVNTIIKIEGLIGENVVSTLSPVANVTIINPPGGLNKIQKTVETQKIVKVINR